MATVRSGVRFDMFGKNVCDMCSNLVKQSGGRGRVRRYCSNRCKMRARNQRVAQERLERHRARYAAFRRREDARK